MIRDMLTEELIEVDVNVSDWQEAINACGQLLVNKGKITSLYIDSMKNAVNEYGAYMVMIPEIALFHGRPNEGVNEVSLSFVTFSNPVQLKEKEIKAAFAFAATDNDSHVVALSKIAQLLQDEEFLVLARNNGSKNEILNVIKKY